MRFLLLIIASLFLLTTCTHDGKNITVKGRVYNPANGEGFSDCTVMLLKNKADAPGPNAGSTDIVASVRPDADGYYELNHTSMFPREVWIDFDAGTNYYLLGWVENGEQTVNTSPKDVHLGKYTFLDYTAVEYGFMKINIHNVNCEGATDELILERNYTHNPQNTIYYPVSLYGCYSSDGVAAEVPMGYYNIKWTVNRPSGSQVFSDVVFVPKNDTLEYTINY